MRFVFAIVSFVLAFLLIGFGIAQRTIFAGPDHVAATVSLKSTAPVTVIDGKVLGANTGHQTLEISGAKKIFVAYGRTADVQAWVGTAQYNKIGYNANKTALTSKVVRGKQSHVPDPRGSDLWLDERSSVDTLSFTVNVPKGISVIVASDGTKAAPSEVAIRWPLDNRTPWSGPLIIAGVMLLLVGLGLYLWALYHLRKARGPRRKSPKMPKLPKQRGYKPRRTTTPAVSGGGRRSSHKRRMIAVVPVLLAGTLALSGCSSDAWPSFLGGTAAKPAASATATPDDTSNQQNPAVTVPQLKQIVARVSAVAAKADQSLDPELLATRFDGPALELRTANYEIRKKDSTVAAMTAIPQGDVEVVLPQQSNVWPRTVFTVLVNSKDKTVSPVALILEQETPRDNYKVSYAMGLEAKVVLPKVASAAIGAPRLLQDNKLLLLPPAKIGPAYGDLLLKGPDSEFAKYFDTSNDRFVKEQGFASKQARKAALPDKATIDFSNEHGVGESIALGTNNSGAIVAVSINQIETVTPTEAGASLNSSGQIKTLSGVTTTLKGLVASYGDQLLFYVPKVGSSQKIVLLGDTDGIIQAKEKP